MLRIIKRIFRPIPKTKNDLEKLGAVIGQNFNNYSTDIDLPFVYLLTVGNNVTFSTCTLLFHDASTKKMLGYSKIGKIEIGDNVFIGAHAIILPKVKIGSNVVIGAGAVVSRDIPDNSVVAGNPAKIISSYDDYVARMKSSFDEEITFESNKSREIRDKIYNSEDNWFFAR